ncbi:hypothetical protein Tco_1300426 [Tanacetum coccineum]
MYRDIHGRLLSIHSLPQPLPNPPPLAPLPVATPDARTQELINKKLKKAKELGTNAQPQHKIDTEEDTGED